MPGLDGTGPSGQGAMTGRAMGRCVGNVADSRGPIGRGFGRGLGRGFRAGRQAGGFGASYAAPYTPYPQEMSQQDMAQRIEALENELQDIKVMYENSDNKR
jgi:Family of unknown function (DUF5320)